MLQVGQKMAACMQMGTRHGAWCYQWPMFGSICLYSEENLLFFDLPSSVFRLLTSLFLEIQTLRTRCLLANCSIPNELSVLWNAFTAVAWLVMVAICFSFHHVRMLDKVYTGCCGCRPLYGKRLQAGGKVSPMHGGEHDDPEGGGQVVKAVAYVPPAQEQAMMAMQQAGAGAVVGYDAYGNPVTAHVTAMPVPVPVPVPMMMMNGPASHMGKY